LNEFFVVVQPAALLNKPQEDGADGKQQDKVPRFFFINFIDNLCSLNKLVVFNKEFLVKEIGNRRYGEGFLDDVQCREIIIAGGDALQKCFVGKFRAYKIRKAAEVGPLSFRACVFGINQRKTEIAVFVVKNKNTGGINLLFSKNFFALSYCAFLPERSVSGFCADSVQIIRRSESANLISPSFCAWVKFSSL